MTTTEPDELKIKEAIACLRDAGYRVYPPAPPRGKPGLTSCLRDEISYFASRHKGWNGGFDPASLLSDDEKSICLERAMARDAFDASKKIFGGPGH